MHFRGPTSKDPISCHCKFFQVGETSHSLCYFLLLSIHLRRILLKLYEFAVFPEGMIQFLRTITMAKGSSGEPAPDLTGSYVKFVGLEEKGSDVFAKLLDAQQVP